MRYRTDARLTLPHGLTRRASRRLRQLNRMNGRKGKRMKTDAQLKADLISELEWDALVKAANVVVAVEDRVVTLAVSKPVRSSTSSNAHCNAWREARKSNRAGSC